MPVPPLPREAFSKGEDIAKIMFFPLISNTKDIKFAVFR